MAYSIPKSEMIDYNPQALRSFNIYMYEWIDNLHFTLAPDEVLGNAEEYIQVAKEIFLEQGWYGDGDLQLMWIPPFMMDGKRTDEFTKGVVIWHVKQVEDGLSWILSPVELPYP